MLRNYIYDKRFQIYIFENKINILNYNNIISFTDKKIIIDIDKNIITINGSDLIISKLLDDELLIEGLIVNVEFR